MSSIVVDDVWKSFRSYHERAHSLKEVLLVRRSKFDTFWALKGVSFDVQPGEMLGIVGSNGSGKSTCLKTIAGVLRPNRGSVKIDGKTSAMLELGTGFHPELSGHDNVYLASSIQGLSTAETDARYDDIVEFSGLHDFMDTAIKNYSSGMYARLAFAVSINVDADVLLVDEVLSVGDAQFQAKCLDHIANLRAKGATIVFVSHSLDVVRSMCSRAVWLHKGRVRAEGDASQVVTEYVDEVIQVEPAGTESLVGAEDRIGTGEVRITRIETRNALGETTDEFEIGSPCTIVIDYEAERAIDAAVCSIEMRFPDGALIGTALPDSVAGLDGRHFEIPKGGGRLAYSVPGLPLVPSEYVMSVGIHAPDKKTVFDWHERTYLFNVKGPASGAVTYVPGKWSKDESD